MEKIDKKDKILLYELRRNCRQPYSRLAKAAKLSKQMVQYRINRLVKLGVLDSTALAIDAGRLGYQNYGVYFQWGDDTLQDSFVKDIINDPKIRYAAESSGRVDFIVSFYARNPLEFQQMWDGYVSKYGSALRSHSIYVSTENRSFERTRLISARKGKERDVFLGSAGELVEIDDSDMKILKVLSHNARASIISIAKKCALSPDTVKSRMRRMEKSGLIQGYAWLYNPTPLGLGMYELLLSLRGMDSKKWDELRAHCRSNPKITYFIRSIGAFDADIVFEVRDDSEFYEELHKLRKLFSIHIHDFDVAKILKEHKFSYAPFL
ncbi:TPA: winged helix-turn-helix transcriptional regulator [Candidatus Micrarchaeota archaeon]|nr:winged helix-turn-helix transcriptional regulator [Candidatus Micrarchaeota archaeon]